LARSAGTIESNSVTTRSSACALQLRRRPETLVYPNGRLLTYNYTAAIDAAVSRLTSISDNSITSDFTAADTRPDAAKTTSFQDLNAFHLENRRD
jgi:hypothetical protein